MKDTQQRLSRTTILLHWIVGLGMIALIGVGLYMSQNKVFSLYPIHKSMGAILFVFIVWRVIWRMINGFPQPVGDYSVFEKLLSKIVHWVLIIGSLLYPISGMLMSVMGGRGAAIFSLELIAPNIVNGKPVALNETLAGLGAQIHGMITPVIIIAIILHVVGAYKHHIIDKDDTMRRILGRTK